MTLEIILRTHDLGNVHLDRERYCGIDKTTLILGCLSSLINAANMVESHEVNFKILDDHSTDTLKQGIYALFAKSKWPYELYNMSEPGYNYSALKQFEFCRDSEADLVYSIEDDYLHCPTALVEMLDCYQLFKDKSGQEIVIFPFDQPDDYVSPWMEPCFVVHGTKRHWRTGTWTTNSFMLRPQVLIDHWPAFEKLATEYNPDYSNPDIEHIHEGNTIREIWQNHAVRFSPIQSLALHMQFNTQMDPYIDWTTWWEQYTK